MQKWFVLCNENNLKILDETCKLFIGKWFKTLTPAGCPCEIQIQTRSFCRYSISFKLQKYIETTYCNISIKRMQVFNSKFRVKLSLSFAFKLENSSWVESQKSSKIGWNTWPFRLKLEKAQKLDEIHEYFEFYLKYSCI